MIKYQFKIRKSDNNLLSEYFKIKNNKKTKLLSEEVEEENDIKQKLLKGEIVYDIVNVDLSDLSDRLKHIILTNLELEKPLIIKNSNLEGLYLNIEKSTDNNQVYHSNLNNIFCYKSKILNFLFNTSHLTWSNFTDNYFNHCLFDNYTSLNYSKFNKNTFNFCTMKQVTCMGTQFDLCSFLDCQINCRLNCIFKNCTFRNINFIRCDISGAQFENCEFRACTFKNCEFVESQCKNCFFEVVNFDECTFFHDNYFNGHFKMVKALGSKFAKGNKWIPTRDSEYVSFYFNKGLPIKIAKDRENDKLVPIDDDWKYIEGVYIVV